MFNSGNIKLLFNLSVSEVLITLISTIYTKLFYTNARLIRFPIIIRGKKYLTFGDGFTTGYFCRVECYKVNKDIAPELRIGLNCKIGDYVHIAVGEQVIIGNDCLLASRIYISDLSHGNYSGENHTSPDIVPDNRILSTNPVFIGDRVWIGEGVSIMPGVTIGSGSIIGANSVITKNVPDNVIVAGIPGKVIKRYNKILKKWERVLEGETK